MKRLEKLRDELALMASQKEWDDYQEHLKIGGNKLHVKSFVQLGFISGFDAAAKELLPEIERLKQYDGDFYWKKWTLQLDINAKLMRVVEILQNGVIRSSGLIEDNFIRGAQVKVTDVEWITDTIEQANAILKGDKGEEDPTMWCIPCGAKTKKQCSCPPIAEND